MALLPITPKAGIVTNSTDYTNQGRWVDGNLVRFQNNTLQPMGGWNRYKQTPLDGTPTNMYAYKTNTGKNVLAVGTRQKVYVNYDDVWYNITPTGFVNDAQSSPLGYGAFNWGVEDYGDARSQSGLDFNSKSFAFDNWGEFLIFCSGSDGKIYQWRPDAGSGSPDATGIQISNSPINNEAIIVTNERHLVALGSGNDPRKVAWSSREANSTWTAAATNTAGDLNIPTGGIILGAKKFGGDIIIFTDIGINRMYYSGSPFIYGIQDAGSSCATPSIRSVVSTGSFLAWFGENGFYTFDGSVKQIPCDVHDYIYDNLHYPYRTATAGGHNSNFNEIIWFFCSGTATSPNKYVSWNYLENSWSVGTLDRSCWLDSGVNDYPLACASNGTIFEHESTTLFNSEGLGNNKPFCTTAPMEISTGDKVAQINQLITDEESSNVSALTLSMKGKFTPNGPETDFGSFSFNSSDGYTDCRISARQVSMTVTGDTNQLFKVGQIRADVKERGKR
tara:strand:+ start:610 stop:2121 length:1512 start_codon:yes stop_codon:yes gene_type:complete